MARNVTVSAPVSPPAPAASRSGAAAAPVPARPRLDSPGLRRATTLALAGAAAVLVGGGALTIGLRTPALGARMAVGAPAAATAAAPMPADGHAVAPMAIVAISPPMAMPVVTATYPIAAAPALADGRVAITPGFDIALVDAAYELSGRPTPGCDAFDADDPVRRFRFSVSITNRTGADLAASSWGAAALTPRGRAMQMCHFSTAGPALPDLPAGQARRVTLSAFVARNESVIAIVVEDGAGNTERLCVRGTRQVACAP